MAFGFSCSEPELEIDEPIATDLKFRFEQQPKYLNGLEITKYGVVNSLVDVKQNIAKLKSAIHGGKKHLLPKLKEAQKKESSLNEFGSDLVSFRFPLGGNFPPDIPGGCWDDPEAGCTPQLNISGFTGMELNKELKGSRVVFRNEKGVIVGRGGRISFARGGKMVMALEANFKGNATMYITPETELFKRGGDELKVQVYAD